MITASKTKWFHVWSFPLLWLPCAVLSALNPGDKNLAFYFATFPGAWTPEVLVLHFGWPAFISQIAGAFLVMNMIGGLMDLTGIYRRASVFCLPFALVALIMATTPYFDADFVFFVLCWSMYIVGTASILVGLVLRAKMKWGPTA